jgi:hypothetical protein
MQFKCLNEKWEQKMKLKLINMELPLPPAREMRNLEDVYELFKEGHQAAFDFLNLVVSHAA